jgi:hypothetical protein
MHVSILSRRYSSSRSPTVAWGRKPWKVYASASRRRRLREVAIGLSCQNPVPQPMQFMPVIKGFGHAARTVFTHTFTR